MISERECFVYIHLPGETLPVTAGKLVISKQDRNTNIGRFIYGKSYLARPNAVSIDPVELTLSDTAFETASMGGLFGAIRDASPDLWGRILIERHLGRTDVDEMDYLLNSPDDRIGALSFGTSQTPTVSELDFNRNIDLERLQYAADTVTDPNITIDSMRDRTEELFLIGTSMGGARPKAVIQDSDALWVAKFAHPSDRYDMALTEHLALKLAQACGINASESKTVTIGVRNILLVKRFDREKVSDGFHRNRMISALTALRASDDPLQRDKWSYILIAEALRRFSSDPVEDARELYRRMVFNALITNTDDHPRNHAFLAHKLWRLSPAYDLTPFPMASITQRDLAMVCGSHGRFANAKNLISECRRFMIEPEEAEDITISMADYISHNWYETARQLGLSEKDCEMIRPAFVYPGFFS